MNKNENLIALIDKAIAGDRDSLETVILSVRDLIFSLSLQMLGTFHDAEKSILAEELDYTAALKAPVDVEKALGFKNAIEQIDDLSAHFTFSRLYESPEQIKRFLTEFLESTTLSTVKNA